MSAILLEHLSLASIGIGIIILLALCVRLATGDSVLRHNILRLFLPVIALIVPLQILVVELVPESVRRVHRVNIAPVAMDWYGFPGVTQRQVNRPVEVQATSSAANSRRATEGYLRREFEQIPPETWLLLYAVGVLVSFGVFAFRFWRAVRVVRRCRPVTDRALRECFERLQAAFKRRVRLLASDSLTAPACWGYWRPAVIVPARCPESVPAEQMGCALRHELIHIQRRDSGVVLLQMLVSAAFWFHPLVWVFGRALNRDRELSCDALVVRATGKPKTYAMTLLEYCQRRSRTGSTPRMDAALAGFGSVVTLKRRLEMIGRAHVMWQRRSVRVLTAVVGLGMILAMIGHAAMAATLGPPAIFKSPDVGEHDSAGINLHLRVNQDGTTQQAEIRALPQGREPQEVLRRYSLFRGPSDGVRFDEGSWITDQETIVSAHDARTWDSVLEADEVVFNLPEGSNLRAILEGESISLQMEGAMTRMVIPRGEIRLVDATGVARSVASAVDSYSAMEADLLLEVSVENDEIVFRTRAEADGEPIPVRVVLDLTTGIPEDEEQPPHGAIRYWLRSPQGEDDPIRLKMQWIYDLSRLQDEVETEPERERASRANQLMEQGRVVEALAELQCTYTTLTDHWRDDRAAADYDAVVGRYNKQLEALTRARQMMPDSPNTQGDLAETLLRVGRVNALLMVYEQAGRSIAGDSDAMSEYLRARMLQDQARIGEQAGDYTRAIQAYQRALLLGIQGRVASPTSPRPTRPGQTSD